MTIIGRRITVHDFREEGEDEKDANPRTGTVLACELGRNVDSDGEATSDYFVLVEFDDGGLGHALVPHVSDALNRTFMLMR